MMEHLNFQHRWEAVESRPETSHFFPEAVTRHVTANYSLPAVHRWALLDTEGQLVAVYFGETENLARRIQQYLNPGRGQQTNIRLKVLFEGELRKGLSIQLHYLTFQPFSVCGQQFSFHDLRQSYVRRFLESLVLALEREHGPQILNRTIEARGKLTKEEMQRIREVLNNMSPAEKRSLFERLGINPEEK
jgi:hypothetical protein